MLEEELVEGSLFVKDISQMYSFNYPTNTTTSVRGFKQFEVVLDTTPKFYKKKYELAVILDVFETEPLTESPLWDFDNVILTPHNSFVSEKTNERMFSVIIENLKIGKSL